MQAALARLEALESDNAGVEVVDLNDDEYGSTDDEDPGQYLLPLGAKTSGMQVLHHFCDMFVFCQCSIE
jgi:hypothetical protein